MDKEFIADCLNRYYKHLESVVHSINTSMGLYENQIRELTRLAEFKPQVYEKELEKVKGKVREADIKLSHIQPRMEKMLEQIKELDARP